MVLQSFLKNYNSQSHSANQLANFYIYNYLTQSFFLKEYYLRTELIWQEGFLIDFLQKKVVDKWIRRFLIVSSYLVNERLIYDWVIRFYMDLILWPGYQNRIFEFTNVGSTLHISLILLISAILFLIVPYLWLVYFF